MSKNHLISGKMRSEIADIVTAFMKKRMLVNQVVISEKEKQYEFEVFMELYEACSRTIEKMRKMEKEGVVRPEDSALGSIPVIDFFEMYSAVLVNDCTDAIVLREEQIDEMMDFVRESIVTCGLGTISMTVSVREFLRVTLQRLADKLGKEDVRTEKYLKLARYALYAGLPDSVAFCDSFGGTVSVGHGNIFSILNHESRYICKFEADGTNTINADIESERVYFGKDLFIGSIMPDNKVSIHDVLFLKTGEEGNVHYIACNYFKDSFKEGDEHLRIDSPLKEVLQDSNLDFLYRPAYTRREWESFIRAYINTRKRLSQEEMTKIEKVASIAVHWWSQVIEQTHFDNADTSELGKSMWVAQMISAQKKGIPLEETISAFETALKKKIQRELVSKQHPEWDRITITVDYKPDFLLREAAREAHLDGEFPWKTVMDISMEHVVVQYGMSSEPEVLYNGKQEDFGDESFGPNGNHSL